jgi:hypothetical protein
LFAKEKSQAISYGISANLQLFPSSITGLSQVKSAFYVNKNVFDVSKLPKSQSKGMTVRANRCTVKELPHSNNPSLGQKNVPFETPCRGKKNVSIRANHRTVKKNCQYHIYLSVLPYGWFFLCPSALFSAVQQTIR